MMTLIVARRLAGVGAHLVGEVGLQELVETEVVAEVFTGPGGDRQPQPELIGVGFVGSKFEHLGERCYR